MGVTSSGQAGLHVFYRGGNVGAECVKTDA
jgi:hypothetical protein